MVNASTPAKEGEVEERKELGHPLQHTHGIMQVSSFVDKKLTHSLLGLPKVEPVSLPSPRRCCCARPTMSIG